MLFGDEHLGKAIAILRDKAGLTQKALAQKIGVKANTMNQYEHGSRRMKEEVIFKVAAAIQCDPIEIWDLAFPIFRFNYYRQRAKEEDIDVEELIARMEPQVSTEAAMELFDSLAANVRPLVAAVLPAARAGGPGLERVVVELVLRPRRDGKRPAAEATAEVPQPREQPNQSLITVVPPPREAATISTISRISTTTPTMIQVGSRTRWWSWWW